MNPFSSISEIYKRWRHSHGFGVHSPFAYELVINTVTPGNYAYYGYEDIEQALLLPDVPHFPHLRHDARLLLRLLIWTGKKRLLLYPDLQPVAKCVAAAAGIKYASLSEDNSCATHDDMILVRTEVPFPKGLTPFITAGAAAVGLDPSTKLRAQINDAMKDGLILEGKRIIVAIPRQGMVLTVYSMRF